MKSTGIVRKVDDLGRIVIPKELRDILGISTKDPLEIFTSEHTIILRKYRPFCSICNQDGEYRNYKGKRICTECISALSE